MITTSGARIRIFVHQLLSDQTKQPGQKCRPQSTLIIFLRAAYRCQSVSTDRQMAVFLDKFARLSEPQSRFSLMGYASIVG